ncbi:MAG TPA: hypothetical protein DCS67_11760, partial [Clostridiales bacterium UBA8960]|nr:hypothetical protein [Clostridiales bacterium UBA8960]
MNGLKWFKWVVISCILACLSLFAFNMVIDPFGVFGDRFINFYAYNMNNNPRVAKIAYLDRHFEKYDSYVVGGSKSSSLSPDLLNQYYEGASFYNMMMYGGDFYDYQKTIHYLVENYKVKNIILHMSMQEIDHYNQQNKTINTELSEKVLSDNRIKYYSKYLTLNLEHAFKKVQGLIQRKFDPMAYATFIPEKGVYNKSVRDIESLGNLDDFIAKYPEFNDPLWHLYGVAIDDNVTALQRIKDYLEQHGVSFTFIAAPTYHKEMDRYQTDDIYKLWRGIARVTDFWDFTGYNSISYDARNFYDRMHYRNSVGNLMIETMFSSKQPLTDFGHFTTSENVESRLDDMMSKRKTAEAISAEKDMRTKRVPIVMYHDIKLEQDDSGNRTVKQFESDLKAYKDAGFNTIHYEDLINFVYKGVSLPENPLIITFDDGYLSNYEYAFTLLKKYEMKAVISIIGWSVGLDYDPIRQRAINPHFTYAQAKEMIDSGLLEIQSHSFDMHDALTD